MKTSKIILLVILALIISVPSILFLRMCSAATEIGNDAINTAQQIYTPSEMLKKYEWFKDCSAQCDQKLATLKTYETRFKSMPKDMTKSDKEQFYIWQSEYLGLKASYNELAAEYNSNMAKFNYAFCNVGTLPKGATNILPREYKPYIEE